MGFEHSPEELKKQILILFTDNYRTYLDAVQTDWASDPIDLETPKQTFLGSATRIQEIKTWPAIGILSGDVFAIEQTQQYRTTGWETQVFIRTFLRDSNVGRLDKTLDRHLQAQLRMFEDYPGYNLNGSARSFQFMRAEPTNSILPLGAGIFIRGLETQWQVRHK